MTRRFSHWAVPASLVVHAGALAAILLHAAGDAPAAADEPTVAVELVQQADATRGSEAPADTPPAPPPPPDTVPMPALPTGGALSVPMPPLLPRPQQPGSEVNLGNAAEDAERQIVTARNVLSPGPDERFPNKPPAYPLEASRLGQEGTVQVLVHVQPDGRAGPVEMVQSSGSPSLDSAVRDAVARWHFNPAVHDGKPVASIYPVRVRFRRDQ